MLHDIPIRQKIIVMIAVMSGLFLVALDQTIIATALSAIVEEFNNYEAISWIVTAYLLTSTVTVPLAGKFSDMFGRKLLLAIGVTTFTLTSLLSGSAQDINQLIIFRALQGVGGGIIMANAFTIIGDLFSPRERGRWQGFIGAVFGISSVVGPLLGGYLTDAHAMFGLITSWRWTFWINVPIGIVALLMILRYAPHIRHDERPKVDYAGSALLVALLTTIVLAVDNTEQIFASVLEQGLSLWQLRLIMGLVIAGLLAAFVWVERKAAEPIIPLRFFANRTFSAVMVTAFLFGAAFLGAILYLTQFNQQVFGATATEAGLMLLPMIAGLTITSTLTGQLITRTGKYKRFLVAGLSLATLSVVALSSLTADSQYVQEALIMVLVGIGLGTGMPVLTLAVQNEFKQKDLGAATAASQLFRGLGSTVGIAVLGSILTVSLTASLSDLDQHPYIMQLRQNPQAAQFVGQKVDPNTALNLNQTAVKTKINQGLEQGLAASQLPESAEQEIKAVFTRQQQDFSYKVATAFAQGLHNIFLSSALLMALAVVAASFIKEVPLRTGSDESPGVDMTAHGH